MFSVDQKQQAKKIDVDATLLSFDHFEIFREKMSDLYMSYVLLTWFNDLEARTIIAFLEKKFKLRTKQVFMRLLFCSMFRKAIYITTRGLGLEEKSITSCPH